MCELSYLEEMRKNVERWMNITSKRKYRNIHINEENGFLYFEVHDLLMSQDYEAHCLNPFYDTQTIIDMLVKNRMEILMREQNELQRNC